MTQERACCSGRSYPWLTSKLKHIFYLQRERTATSGEIVVAYLKAVIHSTETSSGLLSSTSTTSVLQDDTTVASAVGSNYGSAWTFQVGFKVLSFVRVQGMTPGG